MNENIRNYIMEFLRLFIMIFVLYLINNFISWLPFIEPMTTFKGIPLSDILSLAISLIAVAIIIEFSYRTSGLIDAILNLVPDAGKLYTLVIYIFLSLFIYSTGYNITFNFTGEDWIWIYQFIFIAITLFLISKAGMLVYKNSSNISKNIIEFFTNFHKKV